MKTGILVSVLLLGVGITGIVLTKNGYEAVVDKQISQWLADVAPESRVERQINRDFLVSFEDTFTFTVSGSDQQKLGLPIDNVAPLTVKVNNTCIAFPFLLRCSNTIEHAGSDKLNEMIGLFDDYPYQTGWGFNLLTQTVSGWFSGDAYPSSAERPFALGELAMEATTDMSFTTLSMEMSLSDILIPSDAMTLRLKNAALSADLDDIKQHRWIGTNTFSLDSLIITTSDSSELVTSDIFISSETTEYAKDQYDLSYLIRIASLTMNQPGIVAEANDIKLDTRIFGMTARALDLLQQFQQAEVSYVTIERELFDEIGKTETGLELNGLSVTLNGADISSQGNLTLPPFTYADYESGVLAQKAMANFITVLSGDLDTAAPQLLPVLQQYEQMGMIKREENGDYQSEVMLGDGKLTVNGNLIGEF